MFTITLGTHRRLCRGHFCKQISKPEFKLNRRIIPWQIKRVRARKRRCKRVIMEDTKFAALSRVYRIPQIKSALIVRPLWNNKFRGGEIFRKKVGNGRVRIARFRMFALVERESSIIVSLNHLHGEHTAARSFDIGRNRYSGLLTLCRERKMHACAPQGLGRCNVTYLKQ